VDRDTFNQLSHQQTTTEVIHSQEHLIKQPTPIVTVNTSRRHHSEAVSQKLLQEPQQQSWNIASQHGITKLNRTSLHHYISTTEALQESAVRLLTAQLN
jgi:hypothetical protein